MIADIEAHWHVVFRTIEVLLYRVLLFGELLKWVFHLAIQELHTARSSFEQARFNLVISTKICVACFIQSIGKGVVLIFLVLLPASGVHSI